MWRRKELGKRVEQRTVDLFELLRRRSEDAAALLTGSSGWCETKDFLNILREWNRKALVDGIYSLHCKK